jgi:hypothetical protein
MDVICYMSLCGQCECIKCVLSTIDRHGQVGHSVVFANRFAVIIICFSYNKNRCSLHLTRSFVCVCVCARACVRVRVCVFHNTVDLHLSVRWLPILACHFG